MSILLELKERFRHALGDLAGDGQEADALLDLIRRSTEAKFGDYQANFAMPLGKRLRRPPRDVAAEIIARLDVDDLCEKPEIAGPGFINLRLRDEWLAGQLTAAVDDPRLGVAAVPPSEARTVVVDYSAPNVAKPMHVGHIRSTVIGDALCRILRFLGHNVVSDNHLGDWGTQFGMIIYGYKHFLDGEAYRRDAVTELARLYQLVRRLMDAQRAAVPPDADAIDEGNATADDSPAGGAVPDEDVGAAVLAETARLHEGDPENVRLWQEFMPACREEIDRMYGRLGVRFDHTLGESFYHDRLSAVVDELIERGIAQQSQGAVCVFFEGSDVPMLVRKQDGAFLYGTTDLATIRYRMEQFAPDAILYVVDHRQGLHFQHLFATARRMGIDDIELTHVSFGTVLGGDGRPFKTRSGDTVGLEGLLDEAVRRAAEIVAANDDAKPAGRELSDDQRRQVAEIVGIGALKYADLSQNRTSDYVFSYDKMLAMNGNTATYMQYAYARVRSIFARGGVDVEQLRRSGPAIVLESPAERALGLKLLQLAEVLDLAMVDYRPSQLTGYLFELADCYSTFYECCPVLKAEQEPLRHSRLLLCELTARTIRKGLELLGIEVVEKM